MPSHQANLHSFFGGSKPKGEKQASIKGYFAKSKDTDKENKKTTAEVTEAQNPQAKPTSAGVETGVVKGSAKRSPSDPKDPASARPRKKTRHPHAIVDDESDEEYGDGARMDTEESDHKLTVQNASESGEIQKDGAKSEEDKEKEGEQSNASKDKSKVKGNELEKGGASKANMESVENSIVTKADDTAMLSESQDLDPQYKALAKQALGIAKEMKVSRNEELLGEMEKETVGQASQPPAAGP